MIKSELKRAVDVLANAAGKGFEWDDISGVLVKVQEEFDEVSEAIKLGDAAHIKEEVGDVLFAAANLARYLKLDADECLAAASDKFSRRFGAIENALAAEGRKVQGTSLEELMQLWKKVKAAE